MTFPRLPVHVGPVCGAASREFRPIFHRISLVSPQDFGLQNLEDSAGGAPSFSNVSHFRVVCVLPQDFRCQIPQDFGLQNPEDSARFPQEAPLSPSHIGPRCPPDFSLQVFPECKNRSRGPDEVATISEKVQWRALAAAFVSRASLPDEMEKLQHDMALGRVASYHFLVCIDAGWQLHTGYGLVRFRLPSVEDVARSLGDGGRGQRVAEALPHKGRGTGARNRAHDLVGLGPSCFCSRGVAQGAHVSSPITNDGRAFDS